MQVLRRFEQAGTISISGAATVQELAELGLEEEQAGRQESQVS